VTAARPRAAGTPGAAVLPGAATLAARAGWPPIPRYLADHGRAEGRMSDVTPTRRAAPDAPPESVLEAVLERVTYVSSGG
jgi:hypothetical protein